MRILKTILYILLAIVLVLVLLGFIGPKSYDVRRSIEVNAPPEIAMPYITSVKKQLDWGPWKEEDPDMKVSYEGDDRTVGFVSKWESDKSGKGEQRISAITDSTIETELTFYTPWGTSKATGYLQATGAENGSEITWGMRGENDFISRIFSVFMNMDNAIGEMFDTGLSSLKGLIEGDIASEFKGYKIQVADFATRSYVAARDNVAMDAISPFMARHLPRIATALGQAGVEITGPATGLYYTWDESTGTAEIATGFPVSSTAAIPDTEVLNISEGKCLAVDYFGSYEHSANAHLAVDEFVKATGAKTRMPVIEEYLTGPQSEPDTAKWHTKIYYLLGQ